MSRVGFLTDEHIPGPVITVLRSIGYDVRRVKDEFPEGTEDGIILEFAADTDRVVITCDSQFTIVEGTRVSTHAGVIYAEQVTLQRVPEDAAGAIDRIITMIPTDALRDAEFYLSDWM